MSRFTLALLLGAALAGFIYFRLQRDSLERTKPNLIAAALIGLFAMIIVYSVSGRLFK